MAISFYGLGLYKEGYDVLQWNDDRDYMFYNNLSIFGYCIGKYEKCAEYMELSLANNPGYPRSNYIKSFVDMKSGNF